MSSHMAMTALCAVEFLLTASLLVQLWRRNLYSEYKSITAYLLLRTLSMPVLIVFLEQSLRRPSTFWCSCYFFFSWGVYISSALALFFICMEIFRWVLRPFIGLMKYGSIIFRWLAIVSAVLTLSGVSFHGYASLPGIAMSLMRSISVLELCLLAFLCVCMNALQLSVRDFAFGSSLSLAFLAANDMVQSMFPVTDTSLTSASEFIYEVAILAGFVMWNIYAAQPQTVRMPVVLSASSPIYRWNEIASALGHTDTKVAVQQPASGFFLSDVEKVVEKVLARNLKNNESEL